MYPLPSLKVKTNVAHTKLFLFFSRIFVQVSVLSMYVRGRIVQIFEQQKNIDF